MDMETRLSAIEERNNRVEQEKAWEVSLTRRLLIAGITFIAAALLLWTIGVRSPLISALVPAVAYLLSTLSLPWVKAKWMKKVR